MGMEMSCGCTEITGVASSSPEQVLKNHLGHYDDGELIELNYHEGDDGKEKLEVIVCSAFAVFSDAVGHGGTYSGTEFANYLTANKLGTVRASAVKKNPNTSNRIRVWIWEINKRNLIAHLRKIGAIHEANSD
jgi:hypothetical protein